MLLVLVGDCSAHRPSAGWLPWTEFYGCLFPIVAATPAPFMLRRGQGLNAMAASRRGSTRLEDELLPAMRASWSGSM